MTDIEKARELAAKHSRVEGGCYGQELALEAMDWKRQRVLDEVEAYLKSEGLYGTVEELGVLRLRQTPEFSKCPEQPNPRDVAILGGDPSL